MTDETNLPKARRGVGRGGRGRGRGGSHGQHHRAKPGDLRDYEIPPAGPVTIRHADGTVEVQPAQAPQRPKAPKRRRSKVSQPAAEEPQKRVRRKRGEDPVNEAVADVRSRQRHGSRSRDGL